MMYAEYHVFSTQFRPSLQHLSKSLPAPETKQRGNTVNTSKDKQIGVCVCVGGGGVKVKDYYATSIVV